MRSILQTMRKRNEAMKDDYLDWSRIPREFSFVAIDGASTGPWPAFSPIAYQREPKFDGMRWVREWKEDVKMAKDIPSLVDGAAIIGPLPIPEKSLRVRPARGGR